MSEPVVDLRDLDELAELARRTILRSGTAYLPDDTEQRAELVDVEAMGMAYALAICAEQYLEGLRWELDNLKRRRERPCV